MPWADVTLWVWRFRSELEVGITKRLAYCVYSHVEASLKEVGVLWRRSRLAKCVRSGRREKILRVSDGDT